MTLDSTAEIPSLDSPAQADVGHTISNQVAHPLGLVLDTYLCSFKSWLSHGTITYLSHPLPYKTSKNILHFILPNLVLSKARKKWAHTMTNQVSLVIIQVTLQSTRGPLYSALPDVYGQLHLIPNTQNKSLKLWWVGKIIEHAFKRMSITK
jgi:hypothetical protein